MKGEEEKDDSVNSGTEHSGGVAAESLSPTQDATALCTPVRCGTNPVLPNTRVGCGQYITSERELFRCVQCTVPFHRECLRSHFREHETE